MNQAEAKAKYRKTALYSRLSTDDGLDGESMSISSQELLCIGWFLPPNTYVCDSSVASDKRHRGRGAISPEVLPAIIQQD